MYPASTAHILPTLQRHHATQRHVALPAAPQRHQQRHRRDQHAQRPRQHAQWLLLWRQRLWLLWLPLRGRLLLAAPRRWRLEAAHCHAHEWHEHVGELLQAACSGSPALRRSGSLAKPCQPCGCLLAAR